MKYLLLLIFTIQIYSGSLEKKELFSKTKSKIYEPITLDEFDKSTDFFKNIFKDKIILSKNFIIETKDDILIIKEKELKGRGFFLFKQSGKNILQMPHCRYDKYTCDIGWKLFFNHNFKSANFATAHRYTNDISDLAHTKYNYFTAIAKAYAEESKDGLVIQIHGFSKKNKGKKEMRDADIIVSNGTITPSFQAIMIDKCFKDLKLDSKLYPIEIKRLGAKTNTSGKILRELNQGDRFIHIEFSKQIRDKLLKSKKLSNRIGKCLEL